MRSKTETMGAAFLVLVGMAVLTSCAAENGGPARVSAERPQGQDWGLAMLDSKEKVAAQIYTGETNPGSLGMSEWAMPNSHANHPR